VEDLVDPGVVARQAVVARGQPKRLAHGEERVEDQLLRHHAERAPRGTVVGDDVVAHHPDRTGARPVQPGDDRDQRGLAGAVRAEQPEELALGDLERDAAQGLEVTVALVDGADVDRGSHSSGGPNSAASTP